MGYHLPMIYTSVSLAEQEPWEIEGRDPGARTNRPLCVAIDADCALHCGITLAGALISEDWIPNHSLIYAYDWEITVSAGQPRVQWHQEVPAQQSIRSGLVLGDQQGPEGD